MAEIFDVTGQVIAKDLPDGYWLETFYLDPKDKYPGLLGFGLGVYEGTRDINFFDNPKNHTGREEWAKYVVATFKQPVTIALGDVAGNGRQDIFVGYHYGQHIMNIDPTGGFIHWFKNPGREEWENQGWDASVWESTKKFVGRWPSMHRMKCGYFTQNLFLELIALPVVRGLGGEFPDLESALEPPVPVLIFQRPDNIENATELVCSTGRVRVGSSLLDPDPDGFWTTMDPTHPTRRVGSGRVRVFLGDPLKPPHVHLATITKPI